MGKQSRNEFYLSLLQRETVPALGCTEPAAAALAGAYAAAVLKKEPERAEIWVSPYILKNGLHVGIPGTGMTGLAIAFAMGLVSAKPEKELMILSEISEQDKETARNMVRDKKVTVGLAKVQEKIYLDARVFCGKQEARATLAGSHKNLVYLSKSKNVLLDRRAEKEENRTESGEKEEAYTVTLQEILEFAKEIDIASLYFLRNVITVNQAIAAEGLKHEYGLGVGKQILNGGNHGLMGKDAANYAAAMTAAAADARMAGCEKPVMSTAGSGNQGLTATVPIITIGRSLKLPEEKILRALALSILFTIHTKHYLGRLSALCGCSISAAMGVGCGIVYMLGGSYEQMCQAVSTMTADISGVVCDGAKPGCALKIATAVDSAVRAAHMALNGSGAGCCDGIVCKEVEATLNNLGLLGNAGMKDTNQMILQMMLQKQTV